MMQSAPKKQPDSSRKYQKSIFINYLKDPNPNDAEPSECIIFLHFKSTDAGHP